MTATVFISYACADDGEGGWITSFCRILEAQPELTGAVFLDRSGISGGDTWRTKIGEGLAAARVFVVALSPRYLRSEFCLWEWEEFHRYSALRGISVDRSVMVLRLADVGSDVAAMEAAFVAERVSEPRTQTDLGTRWRAWHRGLNEIQHDDFAASFQTGSLDDQGTVARLEELRSRIAKRIVQARRDSHVPHNLKSMNPHFVGRSGHIAQLHHHLKTDGRVGVLTALHGLGGQGKTELALAYARSNMDAYAGGLWMVSAEGRMQLKPLLAQLAYDPSLGLSLQEREADDERAARVLARLRQFHDEAQARSNEDVCSLLILDNLTEPGLIAPGEMEFFSRDPWLRIVVTTRLGPEHLPLTRRRLGFVEVDSLDNEDALSLIRACQPERNFTSDGCNAIREIVRDLGGFTLAVEAVGLYLAHHPDICPSDYLARLREEGLTGVDDLQTEHEVNAHVRHRDKQLQIILAQTLASLSAIERTALSAAAYLPPDQVPRNWLRRVVEVVHPGSLVQRRGYPDPWQGPSGVMARLLGYRLLTSASSDNLARMHRMVGAHLRERRELDPVVVRNVVVESARAFNEGWPHEPARLWELMPLEESALAPDTLADEDARITVALIGADVESQLGHHQRAGELVTWALTTLQSVEATCSPAHVVQHVGARRLKAEVLANRGLPGDAAAAITELEDACALGDGTLDSSATANRAALLYEVVLAHDSLSQQLQTRGQGGDADRCVDLAVRAMRLADEMLAISPGDWRSLRCAATEHNNVACLLASRGGAGDFDQAEVHFAQSLELAGHLATSFPESTAARYVFAAAHINRAEIIGNRGRPEDLQTADHEFRESIAALEAIVEANPSSSRWRSEMSYALNKFAVLCRTRGQSDEACRAFERAAELLDAVLAENPRSATTRRDVAANLTGMIVFLAERRKLGDIDRALSLSEREVALLEQLHEDNPSLAQPKKDLQPALRCQADLLRDRRRAIDLPQIEAAYRRSVCLAEEVLEANPKSSWARRDLSIALNGLIDYLEFRSHPDGLDATVAFGIRSVSMCRAVYEANRDSAQARRDLSIALARLAGLLDARKGPGDAEQSSRDNDESFRLCESILRDNPESTEAKRDLSIALNNRSDRFAALGTPSDTAHALVDVTESVRLCAAIIDVDPKSAQARRDLSLALNRRAALLDARKAPGDAEQVTRDNDESFRLCESILRDNPESTEAKRDLSIALNNRSDRFLVSGRLSDADHAFADMTESVRLCASILEADSRSSQARQDLSIALNRRSAFLHARKAPGDLEQASQDSGKSVELCESILKDNPESLGAKRDLYVALVRRSEYLAASGDHADVARAVAAITDSIRLCSSILNVDPSSPEAKRDLSTALNRRSELLAASSDPSDAARALGDTLESAHLCSSILDSDPESAQWRENLLATICRVVELLERGAMPDDQELARSYRERAVELWDSIQRVFGSIEPG
jgi:tetratricopeptide (TPR) repeat protein